MICRSSIPSAALTAVRRITAPSLLVILFAGCGRDITATPIVGDVRIVTEGDAVAVGDTLRLQATVLDLDGKPISGLPVIWVSPDTSIATVDENGRVTGRRVGAVTIQAGVDEVVGRVQIRVVYPPSAASIDAVVTVHANSERRSVIRARGTAPGAVRLEHYSTSPPNFTTDRTEIPLTGDPAAPTFDIEVEVTYHNFHLVAYDERGTPVGQTLSYVGTYLPTLSFPSPGADRLVPPSATEVTIEWTAKGPGDHRIVGMKVWADGRSPIDLEFEPAQEVNFEWTAPVTDTVTTLWFEAETELGHTNRQSVVVTRTQPAEVAGS